MTTAELPPTLASRVLLLAHDDAGRTLFQTRSHQGLVIRAAVLTDLFLRGAVSDRDGAVVADPAARPADAVLALVHQEILDAARPMKWKKAVARRGRPTLAAAHEALDAEGLARVTSSRRFGVVPVTTVEIRAPRTVAALRTAVEQALGSTPVDRLDPADAALAALAVVGRYRWVVPAAKARERKQRVAQLIDRAGPALPALRKAIVDAEATSG